MSTIIKEPRLFICGITCGPEIDKIIDLVNRTKNYVNGFIWTVDYDSDSQNSEKTNQLIEFLRVNKKEGKIIYHRWQNAHDWQANEWLHSGVLQEGDWIWMFDSSESPTDKWLSEIKSNIEYLKKNNMFAAYASGRPYLFKYSEYLYFHGTPHWGLYGMENNKALALSDEHKAELIINKRDLNPAKHYQEHDTKYYLYGRSNIIDAFYGKYGTNVVNYHEGLRRAFRKELVNLGYRTTLPQLETYFRNGIFSDFAKEVIEIEFCLSEYYRRVILKEDFMKDIVPRREQWSFKNHLLTGDGFSDKHYLGARLKYDKQLTKQ